MSYSRKILFPDPFNNTRVIRLYAFEKKTSSTLLLLIQSSLIFHSCFCWKNRNGCKLAVIKNVTRRTTYSALCARTTTLSRWPLHLPSSHDVQMQVIDTLRAILPIIDGDSESTRALFLTQHLSHIHQVTQQRFLILACFC